jgi:hypothetical protein
MKQASSRRARDPSAPALLVRIRSNPIDKLNPWNFENKVCLFTMSLGRSGGIDSMHEARCRIGMVATGIRGEDEEVALSEQMKPVGSLTNEREASS